MHVQKCTSTRVGKASDDLAREAVKGNKARRDYKKAVHYYN